MSCSKWETPKLLNFQTNLFFNFEIAAVQKYAFLFFLFFFARIGRSDLTKKLEKVGPFECDELILAKNRFEKTAIFVKIQQKIANVAKFAKFCQISKISAWESGRFWKMLQNAYFLAKIGADTAENEQHFAEILPTDALRGSLFSRRPARPQRVPQAAPARAQQASRVDALARSDSNVP